MTHQTNAMTSSSTPAASRYITHIKTPSGNQFEMILPPPLPRLRRSLARIAAALALICFTSACTWASQGQPWVIAGPRSAALLPAWSEDSALGLRTALAAQCAHPERVGRQWPELCRELRALPALATDTTSDTDLRRWISNRFDAWAITTDRGGARGLLTGYFEPVFAGSLRRELPGQTPLYAPPDKLGKRLPFATREQLSRLHLEPAQTAADSAGLRSEMADRVIAWLDDPVDAFFLSIQGSGRIRLRDGTLLRIGYAGHNGHEYVAIGRPLIERGEIARSSMSAQAIRQWLADNPDQAEATMNLNPRYIFFRKLPAPKQALGNTIAGPIGSLGVALTAGRSVATDPKYLPAGNLFYLTSKTRHGQPQMARLTVSQDTGSAIRGAVRADLFTGTGASAGDQAGRLRHPMQLWLLWPKGRQPPGRLPVLQADLDD